MESFGIIVVGPLWGLISVQLFFLIGEEAIMAVMYLIGIMRGYVSSKKLVPRAVWSALRSVGSALLLIAGFWLICVRYPTLRSSAQNVLYLAFAILAIFYVVAAMPGRLNRAWRHATIVGAIEDDALDEGQEVIEVKSIVRTKSGESE